MKEFKDLEIGTQVGHIQPFVHNLERWTVVDHFTNNWGRWTTIKNELTLLEREINQIHPVVETSKESNARLSYFLLNEEESKAKLYLVSDETNQELQSYLNGQY